MADGIPQLKPLTSIRGVAAIWVVLHHFLGGVTYLPGEPFLLQVFRFGWAGVDIFFILSGFILSYCHAQDFDSANRRVAYPTFLILRISRIYPLHAFILLILMLDTSMTLFSHVSEPSEVEGFVSHHPFHMWDLFLSFLLVQGWFIDPDQWNGPAWTISVEWFLYLLFPVLISLYISLSKKWAYIVIAFFYACISLYAILIDDAGIWARLHVSIPGGGILRGAVGFSVGILLYRLYTEKALFTLPWKGIGNAVLLAIPVVIVVTHRITFALPLFAVLIYALAHPSNGRHWFWSSAPMVFLGDISYSIYMTQRLFLGRVQAVSVSQPWSVSTLMVGVVLFAFIIGSSCLTYKYIERPSRNYIRKRWLGKTVG